MEVKGKIIKIGETKEFGTSNFRKREMVLETSEQYPQKLLIDFIQDYSSVLDSFNTGDDVSVKIELRGREWVSPQNITKYFISFVAKEIEKIESSSGGEDEGSGDKEDEVPF